MPLLGQHGVNAMKHGIVSGIVQHRIQADKLPNAVAAGQRDKRDKPGCRSCRAKRQTKPDERHTAG
jgi:hypothetical protein